MWDPPPGHPLRRLFAGITEHTFVTLLGVADPPLIDYLSSLLSRFVHSDTLCRLRNPGGKQMGELCEMVTEANKLPAEGRTCREFHRHIGDYALFWTGLFPEAVNRMQSTRCRDHLVNFTVLGKRSYLIASSFELAANSEESVILRRLSEQFELCAFGLREVRREWEDLALNQPGTGLIE